MSLTSILKEIETNRPNAEMDVTLGNPSTYGGRVGLKRAATEAIKRLKVDYRNALMDSTVFIVVTGPARDSFTQLATSEAFGCFSSDPEDFYKDLVARINPKLFGRESVKGLFTVAQNVLYEKAMELNLRYYDNITFSEKYNRAVDGPSDLVPLVREALTTPNGLEIVGINAIDSVVDGAIDKKHAAVVTPIIFSTSDEKFALELYKNLPGLVPQDQLSPTQYEARKKGKAFLVVAGKAPKALTLAEGALVVKTVSEETVGEALSAIRARVL